MSGILQQARFALDHRWASVHMSEYLDGELVSGGRVRMDRHLGECRQCRQLLEGLRRMVYALGQLPGPSVGADPGAIAAAVRLRLSPPPELD